MAIENGEAGIRWARIYIACLLATVWSVLMVLDAALEGFTAPPQLGAALGVVAYIFTTEAKRASQNGEKNA